MSSYDSLADTNLFSDFPSENESLGFSTYSEFLSNQPNLKTQKSKAEKPKRSKSKLKKISPLLVDLHNDELNEANSQLNQHPQGIEDTDETLIPDLSEDFDFLNQIGNSFLK